MTEVTLQGSEQREKMRAVAKLAGSARTEHSVTSLEASGKVPAIAGFFCGLCQPRSRPPRQWLKSSPSWTDFHKRTRVQPRCTKPILQYILQFVMKQERKGGDLGAPSRLRRNQGGKFRQAFHRRAQHPATGEGPKIWACGPS